MGSDLPLQQRDIDVRKHRDNGWSLGSIMFYCPGLEATQPRTATTHAHPLTHFTRTSNTRTHATSDWPVDGATFAHTVGRDIRPLKSPLFAQNRLPILSSGYHPLSVSGFRLHL